MTYFIFIILPIVWSLIGFFILDGYENNSFVFNRYSDSSFAYLNPVWLYNNYKVNIIGALLLTILFNALCPIITVIYWIIKLVYWICTVGRK